MNKTVLYATLLVVGCMSSTLVSASTVGGNCTPVAYQTFDCTQAEQVCGVNYTNGTCTPYSVQGTCSSDLTCQNMTKVWGWIRS